MKTLLRTLSLCFIAAAVLSCTSAPENRAPFSPAGTGDSLTADSVLMSSKTTDVMWDDTVQIAELSPAAEEAGVDCIEISIFYGETAIAWNFTGLTPNAPVEVKFDAFFDFFDSASYIEVAALPGTKTAETAYDPREEFNDNLVWKWGDGEPKWPEATDGWETMSWSGGKADADGTFSVIMVAGHKTEDPPVVRQYFTNPVVKSLQ